MSNPCVFSPVDYTPLLFPRARRVLGNYTPMDDTTMAPATDETVVTPTEETTPEETTEETTEETAAPTEEAAA